MPRRKGRSIEQIEKSMGFKFKNGLHRARKEIYTNHPELQSFLDAIEDAKDKFWRFELPQLQNSDEFYQQCLNIADDHGKILWPPLYDYSGDVPTRLPRPEWLIDARNKPADWDANGDELYPVDLSYQYEGEQNE